MQHRKLKWHERFQLEIAIRYQLVATKDVSWKQWLFDPYFGITRIGQEITSRYQLPESTSYGVDTLSVDIGDNKKKFYSLVFWLHGAIRILGLDIGFGIFWRKSKTIPTPNSGVSNA